ncbi:Chitin synthase 4-like protein [Leptotrombidium deliense]|uniref:Chitin synthase 4-like protein n=1 Tax=Leptotrombidium deliense TaxID=299467 RepID=A0A443SRB5_9ACAR|nr:Chitin synthase 4-like protein [Leptotrombidium deliense]
MRTDWTEDAFLSRCETQNLSDNENSFWNELIEKYLYPIEENTEHKRSVALRLKELRNRVVFAIFMLNAIFVLVVFLLQLHKEKLAIQLPNYLIFDFGTNGNSDSQKEKDNGYSIEPVASSFILLFGLILVLQVIGMLIHRFSTFSHIIAFLSVHVNQSPNENIVNNVLDEKNMEIIKNLQCLKGVDEDCYTEMSNEKTKRKHTVFNLEKRRTHKQKTMALDVAFRKRFFNICSLKNKASTKLRGNIDLKPININRKRASLNINGATRKTFIKRNMSNAVDKTVLSGFRKISVDICNVNSSYIAENSKDDVAFRCSRGNQVFQAAIS